MKTTTIEQNWGEILSEMYTRLVTSVIPPHHKRNYQLQKLKTFVCSVEDLHQAGSTAALKMAIYRFGLLYHLKAIIVDITAQTAALVALRIPWYRFGEKRERTRTLSNLNHTRRCLEDLEIFANSIDIEAMKRYDKLFFTSRKEPNVSIYNKGFAAPGTAEKLAQDAAVKKADFEHQAAKKEYRLAIEARNKIKRETPEWEEANTKIYRLRDKVQQLEDMAQKLRAGRIIEPTTQQEALDKAVEQSERSVGRYGQVVKIEDFPVDPNDRKNGINATMMVIDEGLDPTDPRVTGSLPYDGGPVDDAPRSNPNDPQDTGDAPVSSGHF